jgi:hypothetical protein
MINVTILVHLQVNRCMTYKLKLYSLLLNLIVTYAKMDVVWAASINLDRMQFFIFHYSCTALENAIVGLAMYYNLMCLRLYTILILRLSY